MIFALLAVTWAPATMAQADQPAVEPSAASYTDAELRSFAGALLDVARIKQAYTPQLEAAEDAEEQQEVKQAASVEMVQAVEQQGMSVDRYQEILLNALTNPELAKRVDRYLKQTTRI